MHRDVIHIRNGAETLTLSRFAAARENGRARGGAYGVDRALRLAGGDPCAMAELRAFLAFHALMSFGYVLTDDEVLRIAYAAIACGALDAQIRLTKSNIEAEHSLASSAFRSPSAVDGCEISPEAGAQLRFRAAGGDDHDPYRRSRGTRRIYITWLS